MQFYKDYCRADKGKHFVLTEKGKEWASYKHCEVGKPIDEDDTWAVRRMIEDGALIEVDDPDWVTLTGYIVVRDYKGTTLPCGNSIIFHDKEMAERYKESYEQLYKKWNRDDILYIKTDVYEGKKPVSNKEYQGKRVFVIANWFCDVGKVGDLVEEKIVMDIANCVPPKTFERNFVQCGEPDCSAKEGETYATFVKIDEDVWEYRGSCLRGHKEQDWTPIPMV